MRGEASGVPAQLIDRIFEQADGNKDDLITAAEIKAMPQPMQATRWWMHRSSQGSEP
jgi:hypothetical protein